MTNRPNSHKHEGVARARLHESFSEWGWACDDLRQDYGEDLFVQIFRNEEATPYSFFVQARSVEDARRQNKYVRNGSAISVGVKVNHLNKWIELASPVFLTVYDVLLRTTYWELVRPQRPLAFDTTRRKKIKVHVPLDNIISERSKDQIENICEERYWQFEVFRGTMKKILGRMNDDWGANIEFDLEEGLIVLPNGAFVPDGRGGSNMLLFGDVLAAARRLYAAKGFSEEEIDFDDMQLVRDTLDAAAKSHIDANKRSKG